MLTVRKMYFIKSHIITRVRSNLGSVFTIHII